MNMTDNKDKIWIIEKPQYAFELIHREKHTHAVIGTTFEIGAVNWVLRTELINYSRSALKMIFVSLVWS